jgi:hypothetical protein
LSCLVSYVCWGDQLCSLRAVCNPLEMNKALNQNNYVPCQKWYFLICNLASVPDTNVAYSYLHENIKKSCYSCWEDPDLKWKEDFPDAKLLTSVWKI